VNGDDGVDGLVSVSLLLDDGLNVLVAEGTREGKGDDDGQLLREKELISGECDTYTWW
jgi:hypothetical protein